MTVKELIDFMEENCELQQDVVIEIDNNIAKANGVFNDVDNNVFYIKYIPKLHQN